MRLRAVEPDDIERMYVWENDPEIWQVSGTTAPFSRHALEQFIEQQRYDIYATRQQRLVIETLAEGTVVGALDLFDFDPANHRAGVGILIHDPLNRGKGYAADALQIVCEYARTTLRMNQLWCDIGAQNTASIALFRGAGFEQAGLRRAWNWTPDGYRDEIQMQKLL